MTMRGAESVKYLKQFGIIVLLSFIGEIIHELIPLPIPASIYGIIILFLCLEFKVISVDSIKEVSSFLIEIMPVMFIPAAVGLIESWQMIKSAWLQYTVITVVSTFAVMLAAGKTVQFIRQRMGKKEETSVLERGQNE